MEKQRKTFLSYSRANKDFAVRLARELKAEGFLVWLDQLDIPAGARWDREVEKALKECEIFMIILTPASINSENVLDEIGYAIDMGKRFLPVLLEKCDVPLRLRRFQYVDFTDKSFDEGVESAKELLRSLIAQPTFPRLQPSEGNQNQMAQAEAESNAREEAKKLLGAQAAHEAAEKAAKEKAEKEAAEREVVELAARKKARRDAIDHDVIRTKAERDVPRARSRTWYVFGIVLIALICGSYVTISYLSSLSATATITPATRKPPVATTDASQPPPISTTSVPVDQPVPKVEQVLIQVTIPPGQVGEAHVDCPNGSVVTGGGYAAGGVIVFTENMIGNGWSVFAQNNSTVDELLNSYAICLFDTTGITTQAYAQASVLPGETGNPVVECPTGSIVTGGGYTTEPTISVHNSSMSVSGRGWGIYATNNTANEILINANAVCLSNISGSTTMVASQVSIPEGEIGNPIAECPAGTLVTSGGFATDTVLSIYNSSLGDNGWQVYAQHNPAGSNLLNVYAICLTIQ